MGKRVPVGKGASAVDLDESPGKPRVAGINGFGGFILVTEEERTP